MESDRVKDEACERPIHPLAAMTLVLVFPARTFARLVRRPHWLLPALFVAVAVLLRHLLALESGFMDEILRAEALRTGADLADVKRGAAVVGVVSAVVATPVVVAIQAVFFRLAGYVFGGRTSYVTALSAVAYASVPIGVGAIALAALLPVTRSAEASLSVAFLFDPATRPFLWNLAMELDVFSIWFFLLLGIAAEPVFKLPRGRARRAAAAFSVAYILFMASLGRGVGRQHVDGTELGGRAGGGATRVVSRAGLGQPVAADRCEARECAGAGEGV